MLVSFAVYLALGLPLHAWMKSLTTSQPETAPSSTTSGCSATLVNPPACHKTTQHPQRLLLTLEPEQLHEKGCFGPARAPGPSPAASQGRAAMTVSRPQEAQGQRQRMQKFRCRNNSTPLYMIESDDAGLSQLHSASQTR